MQYTDINKVNCILQRKVYERIKAGMGTDYLFVPPVHFPLLLVIMMERPERVNIKVMARYHLSNNAFTMLQIYLAI